MCISPMTYDMEHIFHTLMSFVLYSGLLPVFKLGCLFSHFEFYELRVYYGY